MNDVKLVTHEWEIHTSKGIVIASVHELHYKGKWESKQQAFVHTELLEVLSVADPEVRNFLLHNFQDSQAELPTHFLSVLVNELKASKELLASGQLEMPLLVIGSKIYSMIIKSAIRVAKTQQAVEEFPDLEKVFAFIEKQIEKENSE